MADLDVTLTGLSWTFLHGGYSSIFWISALSTTRLPAVQNLALPSATISIPTSAVSSRPPPASPSHGSFQATKISCLNNL